MNPRTAAILAERTPRLDVLTGLRWWAAFMVFLYHMRVFAPLPGKINLLFNQGYFGVTFFFVLSGFVLTWSMRPQVPMSTFYWRRFARIWPAHMVALLVAIPVFYAFAPIPEGSFLKPFDLGILLLSVVVLQAWWANPVILFSGNPAAWTLSVEALFYAIHPWVSRILLPLTKRGALLFSLAAIAWAFAYRLGMTLWPESWLAAVPVPVTRVPEFLLGMGLAWAVRSGWRPRLHPFVGVAAIGAALAVIMGTEFFNGIRPFGVLAGFSNEIFTVATGVAILVFALNTLRGRRSIFETKLQVRLGTWSFAFYLVHATAIYLALRIFGPQAPSWSNIGWNIALLAVDIVLAWLLYRLIEHPVEGRMRRWKDARDKTRAERGAGRRAAAA